MLMDSEGECAERKSGLEKQVENEHLTSTNVCEFDFGKRVHKPNCVTLVLAHSWLGGVIILLV